MEASESQPGSPAPSGGPLQMATPDRVNRRESLFALRASGRESTVHDKISQFNNLSTSMQAKQLEKKNADAALKRAVLGREEAEGEIKKMKEEARILRKTIDEGKERERRVGERLESVMESYGRAKETHAHTQALWEKEIRRSRKENFKSQSSIVKLQDELKTSRQNNKVIDENLQREKERSRVREQEAFTARYELAEMREKLDKALEQIALVEQERDAYKTAAKNEEIARIAAEGRIPLPESNDPNDEFASPPKKKRHSNIVRSRDPRVSLSTMEILSSAASEQEIEELSMQLQWEKQRANRAQEMIEFMQAECLMNMCPCSKSKRRTSMLTVHHHESRSSPDLLVPTMEADLGEDLTEEHGDEIGFGPAMVPRSKKGPRLSTIFCPKEGIFRTVSEQEAMVLEAQQEARVVRETSGDVEHEHEHELEPEAEETSPVHEERRHRMYARTPSVDPPTFALLAQDRTSLLSLINAPRNDNDEDAIPSSFNIPTVSDDEYVAHRRGELGEEHQEERGEREAEVDNHMPQIPARQRPHESTGVITVTKTTTVPVRESSSSSSSFFSQKLRTPSSGSNASFDLKDPAMTPTMTREQALAKIRERRGRARSAAQSGTAPHLKTNKPAERRDLSAPSGRAVKKARRS